ncbi:hypothetical protein [Pseudoclavibacter sp. RFBA6]|uniref:hypothetical protein n=1 Tax=Pseudoclavibacter sp. RFBA6 TaxID=2080573 RepID=UPI0015E1BBD6|nr:hypothetical protein [Pseudoclavibacter sp. RFBA6]
MVQLAVWTSRQGESLANVRGCLPVADLVDWACVDVEDVPPGPWLRLVTTSAVQ